MQYTKSPHISWWFDQLNWNLKPRFLWWCCIIWIKSPFWEIWPSTSNTRVDNYKLYLFGQLQIVFIWTITNYIYLDNYKLFDQKIIVSAFILTCEVINLRKTWERNIHITQYAVWDRLQTCWLLVVQSAIVLLMILPVPRDAWWRSKCEK